MPVPVDDLPANLVPKDDLPGHLAPKGPGDFGSPEERSLQPDNLPWDVPVTGAQMRNTQDTVKRSDEKLPFAGTEPSAPGFKHLMWSLGAGPIQSAAKIGQTALGERPLPEPGAEALGEASFGVVAPPVLRNTAAALGKSNIPAMARPLTGEEVSEAATAIREPKLVKAERAVEKRLNQTGPATAQEAIDALNKGRAAGKPMMLPDTFQGGVQGLAGRMYRAPGESKEIIGKALTDRNKGAVERMTGDINRDVGSGSAYQMFDDLRVSRSKAAKPLFDKAMQGGSIAPLEKQFERAFGEAVSEEAAAQRDLSHALSVKQTGAAARSSQAGDNVYANSGANMDMRAADAAEQAARARLQAATEAKEAMRERLQQAQGDRTANAPGAIWTPRIQQFLDNPRVQEGINRGWRIERDEALAEGRAVNPGEYAVTGFTEAGDPIVGRVPTMKLLAVAKEGIDRMLQSPQYRNELTGELNKEGVAISKMQKEFVKELDGLNPDYKAAREQWSGDTASMQALRDGQSALKNKPEVNTRLAADMTEGEREFAKLGLAQTMREIARDKGPLAGEFNTVAGTQYGAVGNRERIAPFFNDEAALNRFVQSVEHEQTMARSANKITGGSQTAERMAEDGSIVSPGDIAHAATAGALGHHGALLNRLATLGIKAWDRRDPELNAQIARILGSTDVGVTRNPQGRIILKRPEPPAP